MHKERSYSSVRASHSSVRVINVWDSLPADRVDFYSFAAFKQTIEQIDFSQFLFGYEIGFVLAELLCCDCERVFCNSLYFMFLHFILYCGQL